VRGAGVVTQLKTEAVDGQVGVLDGALDGQLLACRIRQGSKTKVLGEAVCCRVSRRSSSWCT
jgi:hypothetical protein